MEEEEARKYPFRPQVAAATAARGRLDQPAQCYAALSASAISFSAFACVCSGANDLRSRRVPTSVDIPCWRGTKSCCPAMQVTPSAAKVVQTPLSARVAQLQKERQEKLLRMREDEVPFAVRPNPHRLAH